MSADSRLRDLTAEEISEAQVRAYAARYLTGWNAIEVVNRMAEVVSDTTLAAQRGEIGRVRQCTTTVPAGLGMLSESPRITGTNVVVSIRSPTVANTESG